MIPLGIISILIQVIAVVHIIRNKREQYWIYIVVFLPTIGAVAYFLVEVLPGLFQSPQTHSMVKNFSRFINPEKEIKELEAKLSFSDTLDNRKTLAEGYFVCQRYGQAIQIYRSCLQGPHKDNPYIIEGLAKACYYNGDYIEARDLILQLLALKKPSLAPATHLLLALAYEQLDEPAAAEKVYLDLIKSFPGEEARYRYARLLAKLDRNDEAVKVLSEILTLASHSPKFYVREQRHWLDQAKRDLETWQKSGNS